MQPQNRVGVLVTGNNGTNNLGVVRNLGQHRIPVTLLTWGRMDMVRYSRYVSRRISCPNPRESEFEFIALLLDLGKQSEARSVIIPTSDVEAMALSRYKEDLEQYYFVPIPTFDVTKTLVNKKEFYMLLDRIGVPHPKTYFPGSISELRAIGETVAPPYIIKPAYTALFAAQFGQKCFVINSTQRLSEAIAKLRNTNLEVLIQEIIPGKEIYMFYTYFSKESQPLAICGYDKLRQYPPDFGSGSLCKSAWRASPIDLGLQLLKAIGYHGMAEPEFKRDPRDGEYKLLEVNARTTTQSALPARCGTNVEHIAYLDMTGQWGGTAASPHNGIVWMDELGDLLSCLTQLRDGRLTFREIVRSLKGRRVYARADGKDPTPFLVSVAALSIAAIRYLLRRTISCVIRG